jgi:uncharacterized membrane protein YbhN (UPF0104 family)
MFETSEVMRLPVSLPQPSRLLPRRFGAWIGGVLSLALFAVAAFVMGRVASELRFADLAAAIRETRGDRVATAAIATFFSYLALVGYDWLALKRMRVSAPPKTVAMAALAGNAFSFTLGLPLLTGAAARYWVYAKAALTAGHVAQITLFATLTFWLGMTGLLGLGLLFAAGPLASLDHAPVAVHVLFGAALVGVLCGYCAWVAGGRRRLRLLGGSLELPGPRIMLAQIALGVADIGCAAAALYALLPEESQALGFPAIAALYVVAALAGGVSHAPGGVGVFEAFMLGVLRAPSQESLLAALLLFRAIYYFVPFILAAILLAAQGGGHRFADVSDALRKTLRRRSVA